MRRRARRGGGRQVELTIEGLGARGDGLANLDGRPVFVPFTVTGDRARLRLTGERGGGFRGELLELIEPGPGRTAPPCPYFGLCGGCALQHLEDARYLAWKQGLLGQALARRGLENVTVQPLRRAPPGSRRRATLAAVALPRQAGPGRAEPGRAGLNIALGFYGYESHDVTDLQTCLLLTPRLNNLLAPLRSLLAELLAVRETASIAVTNTDDGLDVLLISRQAPDLGGREALAAFAEAQDLARLCWADPPNSGAALSPEPVVMRRPPRVRFGDITVEPPPGGFLQPSTFGEAVLSELVMSYLPEDVDAVADLYAGCGTLTFPLARRARVHAVERDEAALGALWAAARRADLAGRITVEDRDLARDPVTAEELAGGSCVVFDPPRAGAREQAAEITRSDLSAVIAVSCNPNSFARDARILVDGGFKLQEVTPIDQFPWTGHLELVAAFRR